MLSSQIFNNLKSGVQGAVARRNLGILAPVLQKATDPIQQLFVDKLREYKSKSGGANKLVDPSPEIERELKSELDKVAKQYGGAGGDAEMTKFPTFSFTDPPVDPIKMEK